MISDNEWMSQVFKVLCRSFQVDHRRTPFYNPRSNAQTERSFGTIKRLLRAVTRGMNQKAWSNWLAPVTFSLNITVSRTTGIYPYQLIHRRDPPLPLTALVGLPDKEPLDPAAYMLTLSTTLGRLLTTARQNYQVYLRRTESTYKANPPAGLESPLGKLVWCWSPYRKKGASGALSSKWSGPWHVITFKPPALTLLQSEWLHRKGKPETQREAVIDKLRLYLPSEPEEEDLEEDELAMIDGDEDATDPLVDAQELLPRMKLLSCRIPPLRRQRQKAIKMVKSMGEGDWGGKGDLEKPEVQTHPSYTDWLLDFVGAGPPLVSGGLDDDSATQWDSLDQGPQPGPSTRPTSASNLPAALRPRGGEVPPQTPPEADISQSEGHGCLSLGPATDGARPPTKHRSEKFRPTFPSRCPKGTAYHNLTANSMPTPHQPTSPAKRRGNQSKRNLHPK